MASPINRIFGEPLMTGLTAWTGFENYVANLRAQEQERRLFDANQRLVADRSIFTFNRNEAFNRGQERLAGGITSQQDRFFRERTKEGLGILSRIGNQDRQDLRQSFGNAASAANAQLAGQGLAGTSIGAGVRAGFLTARTAAQNRLSDAIAERQFGGFERLTGDQLNALSQNTANLLNIREAGHIRTTQDFLRTSGDRSNLMNSVNVQGPSETTTAAISRSLGIGSADKPESPGVWDTLGLTALTGAAGVAGAGAVSSASTFLPPLTTFKVATITCLEDDAIVSTATGDRRLKDVERGDLVLGADGEFHTVIEKDHGWLPSSERSKHVRLTVGDRTLVVTVGHPIGGRKAGEWGRGDLIAVFEDGQWVEQEVTNVERVGYVIGCDIALETNVDYIANGFRVTSVLGGMIDEMGLERFLDRRRELAL